MTDHLEQSAASFRDNRSNDASIGEEGGAVRLEPAERPVSPQLRASAERFVAAVDDECLAVAGGPFHVLTRTLPFLQADSTEDETPQWVPLRCVIGESWRWTEPAERPGREDLEAYLVSPARAHRNDPDAASGWWVPELGIGAMHEGKNRVRYLRETCGASLMPALMSTLRFPGPDRLCLLTADAAPGPFYALMLDKRWLTLLQHPSLSLPLLRSYGIFPTAWPYHLPAIEELLGSCSWQAYAHGTPFALDVDAWQRRQRGQKERLHGDAFGLVDSSPHWPGVRRLAWSAAAIGVLGGVITALSGGHLAVFGAAALTATSVVTGALLALSTPLISAPRSVWAPGQGQSKSDGLE